MLESSLLISQSLKALCQVSLTPSPHPDEDKGPNRDIFTVQAASEKLDKEFFNITPEESKNYKKIMNMIFRKDGKGKFLVEDLVRENQDWENNER